MQGTQFAGLHTSTPVQQQPQYRFSLRPSRAQWADDILTLSKVKGKKLSAEDKARYFEIIEQHVLNNTQFDGRDCADILMASKHMRDHTVTKITHQAQVRCASPTSVTMHPPPAGACL